MSNTYRKKIKEYYNKNSEYYLKYLGDTLQAGTLKTDLYPSGSNVFNETVKYFTNKIGVREGDVILDAGSGVCGPAITLANMFNKIKIHSITISDYQVEKSKELILFHGVKEKINVELMDYHHLIYQNNYFDEIIFFESFGYSDNPQLLLEECHRVLKYNGTILIKDVFVVENDLDQQELDELDDFNKVFVQKTPKMLDTVNILQKTGFCIISSNNLSEILTSEVFNEAMQVKIGDFPLSKIMSSNQHKTYTKAPVYFGEIIAKKW